MDFVVAGGQVVRVDAALRLESLGQMSVGVQGDAVGAQGANLLQRARKRICILVRQAVNQIGIDRGKARLARGLHQGKNLFNRLHAVYGLLHRRIKVLYTKADAVEAQLLQMAQALGIHGTRINLDGIFALRVENKKGLQHVHELLQLIVRQKSGRAAPQMQLRNGRALGGLGVGQMELVQKQLLLQLLQVISCPLVVLGDDFVAGAKVAQRCTKRNVHVQR